MIETACRAHSRWALPAFPAQKTCAALQRGSSTVRPLLWDALAQRALLARDAANPKAAPIVRRLSDVRRRLSALTVAPLEVGQSEGLQREIERLSKQERELSRQLGQALGRPVRA